MIAMLRNVTGRLARRAAAQHGFSMLPAMTAVFVGSLISMGAWSAAHGDVQMQNRDRYGKRAYAAAQTGIADYVQHLAVDSNYWSYCDQPPSGNSGALNDTDIGATGHSNRRWLPGSADETLTYQYTIDLLPTNGYAKCKANTDRTLTMIQQSTGSFRVRVTGRAGQPVPDTATIAPDPAQPGTFVPKDTTSIERWRQLRWKKRSVVIDFRRRGFLDFAYFTDSEGQDPPVQPSPSYADLHCRDYYRDGRSSWTGCQEIQFSSSDKINGPFHTNDSILAMTGSTFGNAGKNDRIEISADSCEWRGAVRSECRGSNPNFVGTLVTGANAPVMQLPDANEDLKEYGKTSSGGLTFDGATKIVFGTDTLTITPNGGSATSYAYPASGVIYVQNKVGCTDYNIDLAYWFPAACGSVEVEGTYNKGLTIAAEADIIITEDVRALSTAPDAVLGLIANKYVRVRHYTKNGVTHASCDKDTNTSKQVNYIEAAMLALQHSFMVDQWACGTNLGTLTLKGGMTQKFRGVVGTSGGSYGSTGYTKDYNYDYRLRYLTPPHFLTPSLTGWRLSRYREQVPACGCNEG